MGIWAGRLRYSSPWHVLIRQDQSPQRPSVFLLFDCAKILSGKWRRRLQSLSPKASPKIIRARFTFVRRSCRLGGDLQGRWKTDSKLWKTAYLRTNKGRTASNQTVRPLFLGTFPHSSSLRRSVPPECCPFQRKWADRPVTACPSLLRPVQHPRPYPGGRCTRTSPCHLHRTVRPQPRRRTM